MAAEEGGRVYAETRVPDWLPGGKLVSAYLHGMDATPAGHEISSILRHDRKQNTYKIALLRAINDVVTGFPDLTAARRDVAVPLRALAARWVAYFWPFADPAAPVMQGRRASRDGALGNDVAFRPDLEALRAEWGAANGAATHADGFFLVDAMRVPRRRAQFSPALIRACDATFTKVARTIGANPIRYAGPGEFSVFSRPARLDALVPDALPLPGARPQDVCVVVGADLWAQFDALSLWVEALCVHEWSLFTETVDGPTDRGDAFRLLTARPDNRVALTWERNHVNVLLLEGRAFACPWTGHPLCKPDDYDLDHLLPLAVYPVNDLWNLVPADRKANNDKRDKLPSLERFAAALPRVTGAYENYLAADALRPVLREGARLRFLDATLASDDPATFAPALAQATGRFIEHIAATRNVATF